MIASIKNVWLRRAAVIGYAPFMLLSCAAIDIVADLLEFIGVVRDDFMARRRSDWRAVRRAWHGNKN
jgi:hypothetical protein